MARPFRFGVQSFNAESGADWANQARQAEALGYSAFHLADHILGPGPALQRSNHPEQNVAAIPAMAYAAAVTAYQLGSFAAHPLSSSAWVAAVAAALAGSVLVLRRLGQGAPAAVPAE